MTSRFCVAAAIVSGLLITGCGKKKKDEELASTLDLAGALEVANDSVDEATDAIAEYGSSGATNLTVASAMTSDTLTLTKSCVAGIANAVVDVTASGEATRERTLARKLGDITFSNKITLSGTETRTWTKASAGAAITCSASNNAVIGWDTAANVAGLKLAIDVNRERTKTGTMTAATVTKEGLLKTTVKGQREVEFIAAEMTSTEVTIEKNVTIIDMQRSLDGTNFKGEKTEASATTSTKTDAPLNVIVVRDRGVAALVWKTLTIKSGTLVSKLENNSRVESTFADVVYTKSAAEVCTPTSGTISGKIFEADATTESHVFIMTFASDKVTKTVDGEEDTTYSPSQTCDLVNQ